MTPDEKGRRKRFAELMVEFRNGYPHEAFLFNEDRWAATMRKYYDVLKQYSDKAITRGINRAEREHPKDFPTAYQVKGLVDLEYRSLAAAEHRRVVPSEQSRPSAGNPLGQVADRIEAGKERNPAGAVLAELEKVFPAVADGIRQAYTPNEGDWCDWCGSLKTAHGDNPMPSCHRKYDKQGELVP